MQNCLCVKITHNSHIQEFQLQQFYNDQLPANEILFNFIPIYGVKFLSQLNDYVKQHINITLSKILRDDQTHLFYYLQQFPGCEHFLSGALQFCPTCNDYFACASCHDHQLSQTTIKCAYCKQTQTCSSMCQFCNKHLFDYQCQYCQILCYQFEFQNYTHNQLCSLNNQQDQNDCMICLGEFNPAHLRQTLACSHSFHSSCIKKWSESNKLCPFCKRDIIFNTFSIKNVIQKLNSNYIDLKLIRTLNIKYAKELGVWKTVCCQFCSSVQTDFCGTLSFCNKCKRIFECANNLDLKPDLKTVNALINNQNISMETKYSDLINYKSSFGAEVPEMMKMCPENVRICALKYKNQNIVTVSQARALIILFNEKREQIEIGEWESVLKQIEE
ncbi:CHY_zinc finger-containing protein [Hexamita inflata]|uniref:CHY zinc finger-containing protein n=1 Tax=Hexamita inflata TaxID=28002 RepID=A0AA86PZ40_9EUKA|nr:CHY zinc finger-containing protein [Hexamita inflata]CAI9949034.1 CHY zinc finger-containing protein [Hexamita inflata]